MAFDRPSLSDLIERTNAGIESRLTVPQTRRSNAKVYSRVIAGAEHELYGYIAFLEKQLFADSCTDEYLDRKCSVYGITRKAATKASGNVKFTFSGSAVDIPSGTILQSDDGVQYATTSSVDATTGIASLEALESGEGGNYEEGGAMTLTSPIAGVLSEATSQGIAGGTDAEDDESLRARLLEHIRERPHGGTASDYVMWAKEVAGVTRAWAYPLEDGDGTVVVRFVCDDLDDITPTKAMVQKVQDYIDTVRPVTADVTVMAPVVKAVNVTIDSLLPSTTAVQSAVEDELRSLFKAEAIPGGSIYISHIRAAISAAAGEIDHELVSPTANVTAGANELLTLGSITWQ